jgi:hypothetical protein
LAGLSPQTEWSIRPFSIREVRRIAPPDSGHPWAREFQARSRKSLWVRAIQPEFQVIFNSRIPYGLNDGPIWAGRGLTTVASAGIQGTIGALEFTIAPQIFRAENTAFPITPNGMTGPQRFSDARYGFAIDLPQRFGDQAYQRLDAGQSSLSLHVSRLALGISTANEVWGPGIESPFLLGTNAAGFGHIFIGSDRPLTLGPFAASFKVIAGRLEQSDYSIVTSNQRRYLTGAIVAVGIRRLPGLELGVARLFENAWPDSGVSVRDILSPLVKNPFKAHLRAQFGGDGWQPDNQIASVFGRWSLPRAHVEVYGELGREDNSYDLRDLVLEPDHDMSYMIGLKRVWMRGAGELFSVRGELLNTEISHLSRVRPQGPPYVHSPILQGHTQAGQLLGAYGGYGGGATVIAVDWFGRSGRRTVSWRRWLREPAALPDRPADVMQAVTFDAVVFHSRLDVAPEATFVYDLNGVAGDDAVNLRLAIAGRMHW